MKADGNSLILCHLAKVYLALRWHHCAVAKDTNPEVLDCTQHKLQSRLLLDDTLTSRLASM